MEASDQGAESRVAGLSQGPPLAPRQLRHTHGTRVRKDFGLEEALILLGHEKADVTLIYTQRDVRKAAAVAVNIGRSDRSAQALRRRHHRGHLPANAR